MQLSDHPCRSGKRRATGENAGRATVGRRIERYHCKSLVSEYVDQGKELGSFSAPTMHQKNPPFPVRPAVHGDVFLFIFSAWSNYDPAYLRLIQDCFFSFQVP
jgi:hypothetical protein